MKTNKKTLILTMVGVLTLVSVVLGATYAYFNGQYDEGNISDITVSTSTVDSLTFSAGNPINLYIKPSDFIQGGTNVSGSTRVSAVLVANNHTNTSTMNYYVYLNIAKNEMVYTTKEKKPELILKVTNPNNQVVTSIDGLTYDSTLQGFDITEKGGLIAIANNYEITARPLITQTWNIEVIVVNLDSDQEKNTSKSFESSIIIQKEKQKTIADVCVGQNMATCFAENSELDQTLLYHDEALTNGANDKSYRYAGASNIVNNYVCFGSDIEICPADNLYRIIGLFDDGTGTYRVKLIKYDYATSAQLGIDGDYSTAIYSGTSSTYKGVQTTINRYYWNNDTQTSIWSESRLNTINLNTNYINYLDNIESKWSSKIEETTWQVEGNTWGNIAGSIPSVTYVNEIVNTNPGSYGNGEKTYNAKIGLMYVSDYGFAASQDSWILPFYVSSGEDYRTVVQNNWMYMGLYEWAITRSSVLSTHVYNVFSTGRIGNNYVYNDLPVRPSFYLTSSVELKSGTGTQTDSYRI